MIEFIRGVIKNIIANKDELARADVRGRGDDDNHEIFESREIFGQYGFSSAPPKDAECLLVRQGQNVYIIASEDRHYKLELKEGEVALHDKFNNTIHLKDGGTILINAGKDVIINNGTKGAARLDDEVEVVIPANTFVDVVTGGSGAPAVGTKNAEDVTVIGKITKSSETVFIGD